MVHTIRGRVQIVLLLAWAVAVILIGLLSSAGGGKDPPAGILSARTYSRQDGGKTYGTPITNTDKEGNTHYGE